MAVLQAKLRHFEELGLTSGCTGTAMGKRQATTSRVELAAIGMADAMTALQGEISKYMAIISDAEQVISQVRSEKFRRILTLRYICGWSLKSVSDELKYSDENSIYRAHGFALRDAQYILDYYTQNTIAMKATDWSEIISKKSC